MYCLGRFGCVMLFSFTYRSHFGQINVESVPFSSGLFESEFDLDHLISSLGSGMDEVNRFGSGQFC